MNCKQCGHMLNSNQAFCPNCGTKVEQGQVISNNMYQQNMNNQMNNQYQYQNMNNMQQNNKKVRYHWEYGCLCFVAFWIPFLILFILSFTSGDVSSIKDSTLFTLFQTICVILGLCTVPAFIISAIVYSVKVKK